MHSPKNFFTSLRTTLKKFFTPFAVFLKRKNIIFTPKRYFQEALSAMAQGLFASLIIGLILKTAGTETAKLFGENIISSFLAELGATAMAAMGAAIGVAVSHGLKAPPLVLFCGVITPASAARPAHLLPLPLDVSLARLFPKRLSWISSLLPPLLFLPVYLPQRQ